MKTIITGVILVTSLTGCVKQPPVVVSFPAPPAERLVCAKEARVPDGNFTDTVVAKYIADLAASGQSCRAQLAWVRDWSARLNQPLP